MKLRLILVIWLSLTISLSAQDLFESAIVEGDQLSSSNYELNGHLRAVIFGGKTDNKNEAEIKSSYGEAGLKLRLRQQHFGDAFAEIRFRKGQEFNQSLSEVNLREAFVNVYLGKFDLRIGHQIVVWGRADGFNPTDNITPKNMLVRSPDEDERREGSFVLRSFYNSQLLRLEAIWAPVFTPSVLPIDVVELPEGVAFGSAHYPDANIKNGSVALKLNLISPSFEASLSYFNGYYPLPGIDMTEPRFSVSGVRFELIPRPYRMHIIGSDFATTAGSYGLRGELAYRKALNDYRKQIYIPNPDFQWVAGVDREIGDFSIVLQYIGRYVADFTEKKSPVNPFELPAFEVEMKNRLFASQLHRLSHAVSFRSAVNLLHQTLKLEFAGICNFTTEETLFRPKITYLLADAMQMTLGGEIYRGSDDTLFGLVDDLLSAIYFEMKLSF
ncbi:MAG TPA: hypothetical protein ENN22_06085 [bacterium]|nr:hypothetical protein [bacterium]